MHLFWLLLYVRLYIYIYGGILLAFFTRNWLHLYFSLCLTIFLAKYCMWLHPNPSNQIVCRSTHTHIYTENIKKSKPYFSRTILSSSAALWYYSRPLHKWSCVANKTSITHRFQQLLLIAWVHLSVITVQVQEYTVLYSQSYLFDLQK